MLSDWSPLVSVTAGTIAAGRGPLAAAPMIVKSPSCGASRLILPTLRRPGESRRVPGPIRSSGVQHRKSVSGRSIGRRGACPAYGGVYMAMYVYSTDGDPIGFLFETSIYDLGGTPLGRIIGSR